MSLPVRRPGRGLAAGIVLAAAAAGVAITPAAAHAAPPTFTWSGADEIAGNGGSFSDGANWADGVAPTADQPVALVFPAMQCVVDRTCSSAYNDVDGLTVSSLSIVEPNEEYDPERGTFGYTIGGSAIALTGPLTAEAPAASNSAVIDLGLHLALSSPADWTVSDVQLAATDVAGKKLAVNVQGGSVDFDGTWAVKKLSVKNNGNGTNLYAGDIGGAARGSISNTGGPLFILPSQLGAFSVKKNHVVVFSGTSTVAGALTLDAKSSLTLQSFATDGTAPALAATKAVKLGNVKTQPVVDCDVPAGTTYTVFSGSKVSGLLADADGTAVPDDGMLPAGNGGSCDGVNAGPVVVHYTATTVTFTTTATTASEQGGMRSAARLAQHTARTATVHGVAITR